MDRKLKVINVIAVSDLCHRVDLGKIANANQVTYSPYKYGGRVAYIKTRAMHGKVSVFNSGKLISVGTRSITQAKKDLCEATRLIRNLLKANLSCKPASIANIVFLFDLGKDIDLETIALGVSKVIYEPEQFPGLIMKLGQPTHATVLLFASGKAIINGVKSDQIGRVAAEQLKNMVASVITK